MANMAFRISNDNRGRGYAGDALGAAVAFCFEKTGLSRLWSDVDVRNEASCRVLEKCVFKRERLTRLGKMVYPYCDCNIYGLLKENVQ